MIFMNSFYANTPLFTFRSFNQRIKVGLIYQPKRSMIRSKLTQILPMRLSASIITDQPIRGVPYNARTTLDFPGKDTTKSDPTQYDGTKLDNKHILIQDVDTGKIVASLTSQKVTYLQAKNIRISDVKHDGSYTPVTEKDFKSKKYVMDDYGFKIPIKSKDPKVVNDDFGNTIPSKIAGGQYIKINKIPQEVQNPQLLKNAPPAVQTFVDAHTPIIDKHVHTSGILKKDSIKIK